MDGIRRAVPDDALGIAIVIAYTWRTAYAGRIPENLIDGRIAGIQEISERLRAEIQRDHHFIVAESGHAVIGACAFGKSRNESFGDSGEIDALYVLKGFQGTGVGKALFVEAVRALRADGYSTMILNCLSGNPSAGFYRKLGGRAVGHRRDEVRHESITEDILFFGDLARPL